MNKCYSVFLTCMLSIPGLTYAHDDAAKKILHTQAQTTLCNQIKSCAQTLDWVVQELSSKTICHVKNPLKKADLASTYNIMHTYIQDQCTNIPDAITQDNCASVHTALQNLVYVAQDLQVRLSNNRKLHATYSLTTKESAIENNDYASLTLAYTYLKKLVEDLVHIVNNYHYSLLTHSTSQIANGIQNTYLDELAKRSIKYIVLALYIIARTPETEFAGHKPDKRVWYKKLMSAPAPQKKNILTHIKDIIGGVKKIEYTTPKNSKTKFSGICGKPVEFVKDIIKVDMGATLWTLSIPALVFPGIKKDIQDFYHWAQTTSEKTKKRSQFYLTYDAARKILIDTMFTYNIVMSDEDLNACALMLSGKTNTEIYNRIEQEHQKALKNHMPMTAESIIAIASQK
ncbi:MAG: hypothetical protein UU47_C0012G0017 [candidate division TM6 bacterium GW2011_GWE2_41_16]|nr:MAG: hypothetical protein UU47_C0012G0017 [candidate division TM6 bacterium GW2011_GWE2_41_16]